VFHTPLYIVCLCLCLCRKAKLFKGGSRRRTELARQSSGSNTSPLISIFDVSTVEHEYKLLILFESEVTPPPLPLAAATDTENLYRTSLNFSFHLPFLLRVIIKCRGDDERGDAVGDSTYSMLTMIGLQCDDEVQRRGRATCC
jgi:hypothetical protein